MPNRATRAAKLPSTPVPPPRILVPFRIEETCTIAQAAAILGLSQAHTRRTVERLGIGRRVLGGAWRVSRVGLAIAADGDEHSFRLFAAGHHGTPEVMAYYARLGLEWSRCVA